MLRGISTVNLWADDLAEATCWYTELLGVEPYFTSEAADASVRTGWRPSPAQAPP
jgi:catechol 2,3-dioxygenase-like lactoylglutathione lyase family enzyme